ncbi:class I SAM-dependent methyltransferase [Nocardioides sp. CFH 31398]|uniref:class I SAM-dependent methyltransferase n=1 Tax=Nocardioides sp. CFH 31398 TaxID=2919579 RepID=UPI001F064733|nr:class I SAM-dependent methyltransferase [Nocardioides sp. CFH 31398]MCH1865754.1 class I SAM-dependent methyltransferase [Nocardioides sp. CFH 31398]
MPHDGAIDWVEWHRGYDDPRGHLAQRLAVVRQLVGKAVDLATARPPYVTSLCAGDGRDVLPVAAVSARLPRVSLVEQDPRLAEEARRQATRLGLAESARVVEGDAGDLATYTGVARADVVLLCGVLGHLSDDDVDRLAVSLPQLAAAGARVVWTRGPWTTSDAGPLVESDDEEHPAEGIRRSFAAHGLVEEDLVTPEGTDFCVGVHRLTREPVPRPPVGTLFRFGSASG